ALATRPKLLLLDEVAGGLSEMECETLVALIRRIRVTGVSVIWIEHVVHALLATVDRIVVLAGGSLIADDRPAEAIRHQGCRNLHGDPGRRLIAADARRCGTADAVAGSEFVDRLLRRFPGALRRVDVGRCRPGRGGDRRQWGRQKHAPQSHRRHDPRIAGDDPLRWRADRRYPAA